MRHVNREIAQIAHVPFNGLFNLVTSQQAYKAALSECERLNSEGDVDYEVAIVDEPYLSYYAVIVS